MKETCIKPMEYAIVGEGVLKIERIALGVGVMFYSAAERRAAAIHIVAPQAPAPDPKYPAQYADVAIPFVLGELRKQGVLPPFSVAVAGGGSMMGMGAGGNLGSRLVDAVKEELARAEIQVKMEETGGARIRSMILDVDAGKIKIA